MMQPTDLFRARFQVKSKDAMRACADNGVNSLALDPYDVASMLNRYLRWRCKIIDSDNSVSWTSSLLFALQ